jgi:hypothetical protein
MNHPRRLRITAVISRRHCNARVQKETVVKKQLGALLALALLIAACGGASEGKQPTTTAGERWVAGRAVYDSLSGIQGMPEGVGATMEFDGNTVSGSGTFYEDRHLNEVRPTGEAYDAGALEGTFSATCPDDQ